MMNCDIARDMIDDACDDLLGKNERERLNAHLDECSQCRSFHQEMMSVVEGLDELRELTTLPSLKDIGNSRRRLRGWAIGLQVAAGVAVVVTIGLYGRELLRSDDRSVPAEPAIARIFEPELTLRGVSADRFLPVPKATSDAKVHFIWLYTTTGGAEADRSVPPEKESGIRKQNHAHMLSEIPRVSGAGSMT